LEVFILEDRMFQVRMEALLQNLKEELLGENVGMLVKWLFL